MDKAPNTAIKNALEFLRHLAEEREAVDKRLVVIAADKDSEHSGHVLEVPLSTEGYNPKEDVLILSASLSRIFQTEFSETVNKIADKLRSLDFTGKVAVSEDTGNFKLSASYEDITFEQLQTIVETYLSTLPLENVDFAVEVTEDQGDGEESKIEDEDYTIFYPDGTSQSYPRKY